MIVSLVDQFEDTPGVLVAKPHFFCNPVDKNGEGIVDSTAHLTCYKIGVDSDDEKRLVLIENQFVQQVLEVKNPEWLCVPSVKIAFEVVP